MGFTILFGSAEYGFRYLSTCKAIVLSIVLIYAPFRNIQVNHAILKQPPLPSRNFPRPTLNVSSVLTTYNILNCMRTRLRLLHTFDSSVGRAVDCSWSRADIHRSLVQIRLEGTFIFLAGFFK
jgi:hypothetical protein